MPLYQDPPPPPPARNNGPWPRGLMGYRPNQYWEWIGYNSNYPVRPDLNGPNPHNPSALYIGADGMARYGGNPYNDRGIETAAVWQERTVPSPWRSVYDAQGFQDDRAYEEWNKYYRGKTNPAVGNFFLADFPYSPSHLSPYYDDPANLAAAQQHADSFTQRLAFQKLGNAASIERQKSPRSAGRVVNSMRRRGKK